MENFDNKPNPIAEWIKEHPYKGPLPSPDQATCPSCDGIGHCDGLIECPLCHGKGIIDFGELME